MLAEMQADGDKGDKGDTGERWWGAWWADGYEYRDRVMAVDGWSQAAGGRCKQRVDG